MKIKQTEYVKSTIYNCVACTVFILFITGLGYVTYIGGLQRAVFFFLGGLWTLAAIGMAGFAVGSFWRSEGEERISPIKAIIYLVLLLGLSSLGYSSIKWAITGEGKPPYLGGDSDEQIYLRH